jgi:predicted PP-loop superfamily ATPase
MFFGIRICSIHSVVEMTWHRCDALRDMSLQLAAALTKVRGVGLNVGRNVVAFSGGVDSSVVLALVHKCFPQTTVACIGARCASRILDSILYIRAHSTYRCIDVSSGRAAVPCADRGG